MGNRETEEDALLGVVNRIEELVPISAKREEDEAIKCGHLITANEKCQWSKIAKDRLRAPYYFTALIDAMYTSIEYFGTNPVSRSSQPHVDSLYLVGHSTRDHQLLNFSPDTYSNY